MRKKLAEGVFVTDFPKGLSTSTTRRRSSARDTQPFRRLPEKPQDREAEAEELMRLLGPQISDWQSFDLPAPSAAARGRRGDVDGEIQLQVELRPDEQAVLLLEQDGVYSWNFGTLADPADAPGTRRGTRSDTAGRRMEFTIGVGRQGTRGKRRGRRWLGKKIIDYAIGKVKAYAIKFAAGLAAQGAMYFLERNVRPGMVALASPDISSWTPVADLSSLTPVPQPKILLMVHGTFSSTHNSFAGLAAVPQCRGFLENALEKYDAVIGFDHRTLSETPLDNAKNLLGHLKTGGWQRPRFDAIAYSRGGLVLRSLVERLLTDLDWRVERAVMVGCTNGGTELANPENWESLIDVSTNLAVAGSRVLGLIPGFQPVSTILAPVVDNLGEFAKYLVTTAVRDRQVPGLAAMDPNGDFVRNLNVFQPGQPRPEEISYYAITSSFDRKLFQRTPPPEIPKHLFQVVVDKFADALMGVENDLVVDVPSMTEIDPGVGRYVKEQYDFGKNGEVYHTNYFFQPATAYCLHKWLDVEGKVRADRRTHRAGDKRALANVAHQRVLEVETRPVPSPAAEEERPYHGPQINVEVVWGDIRMLKAVDGQVLAAGHYRGVLPQRAELALDMLVSGVEKVADGKQTDEKQLVLTQQTRRGILRGELGDIDLFPVAPRRGGGRSSNRRGKPVTRHVAICGMGYQSQFGELQLRTVYRSLLAEMDRLPEVEEVNTVLIGSGEGGLSTSAAVELFAAGFAEELGEHREVDPRLVKTVRIVEQERSKAEEILKALNDLKTSNSWMVLEQKLREEKEGRIDKKYLEQGLLAGARKAAEDPTTPEFEAVQQLVNIGVQGVRLRRRVIKTLAESEKKPESKDGGDRPPHRVSIRRDGPVYRVAAITNETTVPERILGVDASLIRDAVRRMTDPYWEEVEDLGGAMTRLIWPREFQAVLAESAALILEVDRDTAPIQFEMCWRGLHGDERQPIGLHRPVARQIRTTYSPPLTPDEPRKRKPRALVIGDPGDPGQGEDLPGARDEAISVIRLLRAKGFEVTGLIGCPGTDLPRQRGIDGYADRFDVVQQLLTGDFDLVHYSGHCDFDPDHPDRVGWLFAGGMLTSREIESMESAPTLVMANACLSSQTSNRMPRGTIRRPYEEAALLPTLADEFFRRGVRNYIGTAWPVDDEGAICFAQRFYESFIQSLNPPTGESIGKAMLAARLELDKRKERYQALWAAYQHYGDPGFKITDMTRGLG